VLHFPDGTLDLPQPERIRLLTNRRFLSVAYWLNFSGDRKAIFHPRGYVLRGPRNQHEILLGGPLQMLGSAAIMQDENLGRPDAKRLWWEITLGDQQGHLLDTAASTIEWSPKLTINDGGSSPSAPLSTEDQQRLSNLSGAITLSATYTLNKPEEACITPLPFVNRQVGHCSTSLPPYRDWQAQAYLSTAERALANIALARTIRTPANHHVEIKWWLNHGAVGAVGHGSVTMPFSTFLDFSDWYSHPWAIAHEMLHNFSYGHGYELNRIDWFTQEQSERFRWYVTDHPEYVPDGLDPKMR
jgi:hypothetical protein